MLRPRILQLPVDMAEIPQHPRDDRPATTRTRHPAKLDQTRPNLAKPLMVTAVPHPANLLHLRRPRRPPLARVATEPCTRMPGHKRTTATGAHPNLRREPVPARPRRSSRTPCRTNLRTAPVTPPLTIGTRPKPAAALLTNLHGSPPRLGGRIGNCRGRRPPKFRGTTPPRWSRRGHCLGSVSASFTRRRPCVPYSATTC